MSFSVSVTMIIISSFTETLCVVLFPDSIDSLTGFAGPIREVSAVQSGETAKRS